MTHWLTKCAAFTLLLLISGAHAQTAGPSAYLTVDGQVEAPLSLTQADFQALPRNSVTVTDAGGKQTVYSGVDLGALLLKAGVPLKQDLKGSDVAKYLRAQGADGYIAIFSLPEFDSGIFPGRRHKRWFSPANRDGTTSAHRAK